MQCVNFGTLHFLVMKMYGGLVYGDFEGSCGTRRVDREEVDAGGDISGGDGESFVIGNKLLHYGS